MWGCCFHAVSLFLFRFSQCFCLLKYIVQYVIVCIKVREVLKLLSSSFCTLFHRNFKNISSKVWGW